MRIVAGEFRSRILQTLPGDNTRPTLDKVREAVFSRIGPYFENGERILDLFAGSGAIGLEALSRGAKEAVFVDKSFQAIRVIKKNIESLKVQDRCRVLNLDYNQALNTLGENKEKFDLIYLDPPYKLQAISQILKTVSENELIIKDGIIIAETLKEETIEVPGGFEIEKEAFYGITKITYIRYKGEEL
ncbi:MAG: 16S rRNA (guanine(966)-N(2))-methyltransferase RsmD [Erysipelotrichaceae bacterium]|nr:16S rRNA (guanine(966)-N(2))-methyltransferase RsmD [Erysipelotrichaceae bacterium]